MARYSGTMEHTEVLRYIVNYSRNKKNKNIIKPLDLKNAFGEVNHDLNVKVPEYNQLPTKMKELFKNHYENYAL